MKLVKPRLKSRLAYLVATAMLVAPGLAVLIPSSASAGTLTTTYLRLNRLKAGQTTSFRLVFTTVGAGATTVAINFNGADSTTWTGTSGAVSATQTATGTAGCDASATALPGTLSASGTGSTINITGVTALSAATTYCVDLDTANAVTNANAGEYHPTITVGSDSTTVAVRTITEDQVAVSATVPPTFNFVLDSTTTDAFGNLSTSASDTTGKTVTLTTNATSGWILWVKDANSGLTSTAAAHTINSTTAGTACSSGHTVGSGTEAYGLVASINTNVNNGTLTIDGGYNCAAGTAGGLDTTYRVVASATGTTNGDIINVKERAAVVGSTPAANDYADTLTFTGAGNF